MKYETVNTIFGLVRKPVDEDLADFLTENYGRIVEPDTNDPFDGIFGALAMLAPEGSKYAREAKK